MAGYCLKYVELGQSHVGIGSGILDKCHTIESMHTTAETRIHIVTVAYNPGPELDAMVESLHAAIRKPGVVDADTDAEIKIALTIVDNGNEPQRVDALASRSNGDFPIHVVRTGENLGYGRAANLGLADAETPWVCVANPDTVFQPGALLALLAAGDRWPNAGIFGPQLLESNGHIYPSARALPSLRNGVGHALFAHLWPSNPWTSAYHGTTDSEHITGWLSGACLLIRTAVWREIDGFDPGYFMFFEDVDLGRRASEAGYVSVYVPSAVVIHEQGTSWKARPSRMIHAHHNSAKRYLGQAYSRPVYVPLRAVLGAGLNLRAWWQTRGRD